MRILFDENLGDRGVVRLLRKMGHQIRPINKTALRGIIDGRVVEIAFEENFIIITLDKDVKDFYDQHSLVPFGLIFFRERNARGVRTKGELAKRIAWTIDHISKNPEWLENPDGLAEFMKSTPYGEWKIHWQVGKPIVEGLLYVVEYVQLSEHVKVEGHLSIEEHVQLSEHVELKSVPVEHDEQSLE